VHTWKDWIALSAIIILLLIGIGLHQPAPPAFVRSPYLGFGADPTTTMMVSWKLDRPFPAVVRFGPQKEYEKTGKFTATVSVTADSATDNYVYHVPLTGLAPDTEYAYQVEIKAGLSSRKSEVGEFWTASSDLERFVFDVYGDTRTYSDRHRMVIQAMAHDHPRFVVHTGDLVESGGVEALWDDRFFRAISSLADDAPFLTVLGNHEQNSPQYYEGFSLPPGGGRGNKEWWSIDYGTVHLVGLDTNVLTLPHGFKLNRDQIAWLKADLSAARKRGKRFIFVFFHHPLFTSDREYSPGNTGLRQLWHPIFKEYGVTAVFCGHCHNYERLVEDGVNYIVTGGGGAPLSGFVDTPISGSVKRAELLHYVRVTITGDQAEIAMVPVGKVENEAVTPLPPEPFDSITISAPQTASAPVGS